MDKGAEAEIETDKKKSEARENLLELLANAVFSESERKTISSDQMLPGMEEDKMIEEIRSVANLVEGGRIHFQVASKSSRNIISWVVKK